MPTQVLVGEDGKAVDATAGGTAGGDGGNPPVQSPPAGDGSAGNVLEPTPAPVEVGTPTSTQVLDS